LGERIGVSGSYISTLESGKASARVSELEDLAAHFRTTAFELLREANAAQEGYVVTTVEPDVDLGLDHIAAELSPDTQSFAREFLLFLRERERVDKAGK
jgi:transcriptional regulator with XRE-family HTH domain